MKKIIIAAALLFTTGILASCTKISSGVQTSSAIIMRSFSDRKDLGSGD
jgi:hypothetical protein